MNIGNDYYRVAVIGQGYVGLPLAHAAVAAGHHVVGFDVDADKVDGLRAGVSPIEDVSHADVAAMINSGRYQPTGMPDTLALCNVYVVTVPTPLRDGRPDLAHVIAAARSIGPMLSDDDLVVLESTVAPGTTSGVFHAELGRRCYPGVAFHVAFSPERIDPGNPHWHFRNTPKLVGGAYREATDRAAAFYATICDTVVRCATPEVAEMAKLLENTYRYVNIALINELARHAADLRIPIWDVVAAAGTKPYGFHAFWPGPGVGGHCLPVDPMYLSDRVEQQLGRPFALVDLADRINAGQPRYVVERAGALLNRDRKPFNGSHILILGAAYKAGTADMREAPAADIIRRLVDLGAVIAVADPRADLSVLNTVKTVELGGVAAAASASDLVILVTDHAEFDYRAIAKTARLVLDTRNRFTPAPNIHKL